MAIAGGGTAGHVTIALALADAYRRADADVSLLFIGTRAGVEGSIVPKHGYACEMVSGGPLAGQRLVGKLRSLSRLPRGTAQARRLLRERDARLVIGLGGYASVPVMLAARSLGLRTVIHESNVVPGLANRWLGRLVDRVYVGSPEASASFRGAQPEVTGNPVRSGFGASAARKQAPSARVVVTGGSLGSSFLNRHAPALLGRVAAGGRPLTVLHQTGDHDHESVRSAYAVAGLDARVVRYVDDMAAELCAADFAISCAGAATLAELAACALPCLLVPLSRSAGDHQLANTTSFVRETGALWAREDDWRPEVLAGRIAALLGDERAWNEAAQRIGRRATPDAGATVVAGCEALMGGRW